ncbi:hypothetical protein H6G25_16515 [Dolichospermum sp. FACHB-1091]|uniref:hypothetical protein n=1 Tax=Dolichospermum sp. FACHB-1091 TaxID=2692798 RepID=UPI0016816F62|nr:hypothetical protein [Dolichospermum sp. FACHB-1091]MBD2444758.1 hypothetical protein [Dolichospermum sp. FACHB-1091]
MINFIDNAIAPQHPNFKRTACSSAYAIAPQHPQIAIPRSRNAYAHNTLILGDRSPNLFLNSYSY